MPRSLPTIIGNVTPYYNISPNQVGSSSYTQVSAGNNFTTAVQSTNALYGWGLNTSGQVGDATTISKSTPVQLLTGTSFTQVKSGTDHSLAIKSDGTLYAWGNPLALPVASGTTISSWTQVYAGLYYTLAITSDNRLFAWGGGTSGATGIGATTNRSSPVLLGSGYAKLPGNGSYASHAAAIRSDGTLWMWGTNSSGQFGDGTTISRSSPIQVAGSWNQIYLGNNSTYGLKADGSLFVWGNNGSGQLALNDAINRSSPVQVTSPSVSWSQIAAGFSYALGLDSLGKMYGWGLNTSNQLGTMDGAGLFAPVSSRSLPVQIGLGSSWTNIAATYTHSAGIKQDSSLWLWGEGAAVALYVQPISWTAVASGMSHTLAVDKLTGKLWSWGLNNFGQLGVNDATNRTSPTLASYMSSYTQVAAGQTHSAAIDVNGAAYVWGYNGQGAGGDNSVVTKSMPVQVAANFTVVDVSTASTNTITRFGTTVSTSIVPVTGAVSGYFSGVANYLTTPSNASFAFGTNPYTVETWVYLRAISPTWGAIFEAGNATNAFEFLIHATGYIYLGVYAVGAVAQTNAGDVPFNTWTHVAVSRVTTGTNDTRIFVNGVVKLAFTDTNNWTVTTTPSIGGYTASGYYLGGYLSNLRIVNGAGVYSGTFTPPTQAVLAISGAGSAAAYPSTANVNTTFSSVSTSLLIYTTLAASITGAATTSFTQVSTGEDQTLLVSTSGAMYVTGGNAGGQLGLGDVVNRSNYTILPGSTSWTTTASGLSFSIAISTTGALYAWGLNASGQVGVNDTINRSSPVQVAAGWSWTAISSGREHTLAIRSDGSLWTWGFSGAVGLIVEPQSWASLSAGSSHTLGVRSDGGLFGWGTGTSGQVGDNQAALNRSSPIQIGTSSWSLVAAGKDFSLALDINKKLYAWGVNNVYQLGTGDSVNRSSPTAIGTSSWVAITAGADHALAVKLGGTLWGWGNNTNGQVGPYGTTNNSWISATTSSDSSAAVRSDGTLWTWGLNNAGQLGLTNVNVAGDTLSRSSPVQVGALTNWSQVSMGASFTTAINTSGIIYAWGLNNAFQLGTGDSVNRSSPVLLTATGSFSTSSFTTVSAGGSTVHAIKSTGALFGWGLGTSGEVGDGTALTRSIPTQVGSLSWNAVSTGHTFRAGITNVGTLYTWGLNNAGQLGTGDTLNRSAPTLIGSSSWTLVAAGSSHAVASTIDFRLHTWGLNASGQLGLNDLVNRSTPTQVLTADYIGSWTTLAAGADQTAASTGFKILVWGLNTNGGLGDGTTVNKSNPAVSTTNNAIALRFNQAPAGSSQHGWAIRSDGSLFNWGINTNGQAGDGTTVTNRSVAVVLGNWPYVSSPVQIGSNAGSWSQVSAGASYTLGISTAGLLYGWGVNNLNQTGYPVNTYDRNLSASQITSGSWTSVAAGFDHGIAVRSDYTLWTWGNPNAALVAVLPVSWTSISSQGGTASHVMAIRSDGALFAWGLNSSGQLGTNDSINRSSPTQIGAFNSWSSVAAGVSHSMAIRNDGKLYVWGLNSSGQVGDGTTFNQSSPIQVGNSSWSTIAAGSNFSYAIRTDGGLFAWGSDAVGSLGDGITATNRSSPVQIGSSSWTAVATSISSTYAISASRLYSWGNNAQNQLGDGSTLNRSSPTIIGNWLGKSWSSVSAGGTHAAAITSLGELYAWGQAADIGTNLNSWSQIASGLSHTVGLRNDGMLFAWGNNASGQLGTGDTLNRSIPVLVGAATGGVSAYTQIGAGDNTTFAIRSEGTLWAAGINTAWNLGDGTSVNKSNLVQVYGPTLSWTKISAGTDHGAAITAATGKLYTWGTNTVGQLGDTTVVLKSVPTLITGTPSWSIVSAGQSFTAAIDTIGRLFTWGLNTSWQLGDGTSANKSSPVSIGTGASSYTQVSVGINHGLAISFRGGLYSWGTNNIGQLGTGDTVIRSLPVQIGTSSWSQVDAGISHSSAIRSDTTLWAWGLGTTGQLGQNDILSRSSPVQIGYGSNWTAVNAGGSWTGALNNSNLMNWGLGTSGQLGDSTIISKSFPLQVGSVTFTGTAVPSKVDNYSYTQVTAGTSYTLARLASTNGLYGWGVNSSGQLGDNTTAFRVIPSTVGTTVSFTDATGLNTLTGVGGAYPVPINPFSAPYNDTSVYGGSIRFVGTKSSATAGYVSMPAINSYIIPTANTPFTIEAWIFQIPDVPGVAIGGVIFCEQNVISPAGPTNLIFALTAQADIGTYGQVSQSADPFVSFGWYAVATGFTTAATSTVRVSPGQWYHVAAVFTGSTSKIFINGIDVTYSGALNTPATSWGVVGTAGDGLWYIAVPRDTSNTSTFYAGLISNLRWVIGTAVYTTNFTPSANPLTITQSANVNGNPSAAIASGTVLLAAKDILSPRAVSNVAAVNTTSYAVDTSRRAYVWGVNNAGLLGDQSVLSSRSSATQLGTSFTGVNNGTGSPVLVVAAGTSWSLVSAGTSFSAATTTDKVLYNWGLNSSGQLADNTVIAKSAPVLLGTVLADASSQKAAVSPVVGAPAVSATFGPVSGGFSESLSGTTQMFGFATGYTSVYNWSAGQDFTMELWAYPTNTNARTLVNFGTYIDSYVAEFLLTITNTYVDIWISGGSTSSATQYQAFYPSSTSLTANAWNHIALVRYNNNLTAYLNGVAGVSVSAPGAAQPGSLSPSPGQSDLGMWFGIDRTNWTTPNNNLYFAGYMSNIRYNKGTAVYTGNFTTPTLANLATTGAGSAAAYPSTTNVNTTFAASTTFMLLLVPASITGYNFNLISAGATHFTSVTTGNLLYAWGSNSAGSQLGDASIISKSSPVLIGNSNFINAGTGLPVRVNFGITESWAGVAAGWSQSLGLTTTGKLYTWGYNAQGQLGNNSVTSRSIPSQVGVRIFDSYNQGRTLTSSYTQVAAGSYQQFALSSDSTLWGWGQNNVGQLGTTFTNNLSNPTQLGFGQTQGVSQYAGSPIQLTALGQNIPQSWSQVSVGQSITGAVSTNNVVYVWGANNYIARGVSGASIPVRPGTLNGKDIVLAQVSDKSGNYTVSASGTGQYPFAWDFVTATMPASPFAAPYNDVYIYGGAFYAFLDNTNYKALVTTASASAQSISTGDFTIELFALVDGGISGGGRLIDQAQPTPLMYINTGGTSGTYTIAVTNATFPTQPNVWYHMAWTRQSGVEYLYMNGTYVGTYTGVVNDYNTLATMWIGYDAYNGTGGNSRFISNLRIVKGLAVYTGTSSFTPPSSPLSVISGSGYSTQLLACQDLPLTTMVSNTTQVSTGQAHFFTKNTTSQLWAWGYSLDGRVGFNNAFNPVSWPNTLGSQLNTDTLSPVLAAAGSFTQLAAGQSFSGAINTSGSLFMWGLNNAGQMGQNDVVTRSSPTQLGTTTSWSQVAAGGSTAFARNSAGSIYIWGLNTNSNFGLMNFSNTSNNRSSPVVVGNFYIAVNQSSPIQIGTGSWKQVSAGASFTAAIKSSDSSLWMWGLNSSGQLGKGSVITFSSSTQIGTSSYTQVSAGNDHTLAIFSSGTLGSWGNNAQGQLGIGTTVNRTTIGPLAAAFQSLSWTNISAGLSYSLAVDATGYLYGWGIGTSGQLGDTTAISKSSPVLVSTKRTNFADTSTNNTLTAVGNAYIGGVNPFSSPYNATATYGGCGAFDGTGDYITTPVSSNNSGFGTSDFTIEAWIYPSAAATNITLVSSNYSYGTGAGNWGFYFGVGSASTMYFNSGAANTGATHASSTTVTITARTWTHIAYVRGSGIGRFFVNGTKLGTDVSDTSNYSSTAGTLYIGSMADGTYQMNGFISNLRITNGIAVYTGNFTVPTIPLTLYQDFGTNISAINGSQVTLLALQDNTTSGTIFNSMAAGWGTNSGSISNDKLLYVWGSDGLGIGLAQGAAAGGLLRSNPTLMGNVYAMSNIYSPMQVGTGTWLAVSAGTSYTVGIDTNYRLWAWGNNSIGQLGDKTIISKSSPVQIGYNEWNSISAGLSHTAGLTKTS
jgi:alpha-tubulin suppressor-like RCC1 family protein